MDLSLVKPSQELKTEIWEYRQEYLDYGSGNINGSYGLAKAVDFESWLKAVLAIENDELSHLGVNATTFFTIRNSDQRIVGSIQLRHILSASTMIDGGHIGYGIRPSERGKGYGNQQLQLVLQVARQMGLTKVMITCAKHNQVSAKTAMSCGGVLTDEYEVEGEMIQVYWIDL
jgi:predicted acetyltransferase